MNTLNSESNAKATQAKMHLNETQIDEAISGHEARNTELRRVFIEKGVDFGKPRSIECHFWTWSKEHGAGLAAALTTLGFRILAQRPATSSNDPSLWNVEAAIQQSIELTLRREFTDELVRVAAAHSGRYDGWGTHV